MNTLTFWWPHPDAFEDLTVEGAEEGYTLSAPDDSECGEWLSYWSQDEAHHKVFETEFIQVLTDQANKTLETHGENQSIPVGNPGDSEQAEVHCSRPQPEYEPGSDTFSSQTP
jgi:hypothetical protein